MLHSNFTNISSLKEILEYINRAGNLQLEEYRSSQQKDGGREDNESDKESDDESDKDSDNESDDKDSDNRDSNLSDEEQPMSSFPRTFVGDGAPIKQIFRLLDEEKKNVAEQDPRYSLIFLLAGVFHFFMEVFKMANKVNIEMMTHLVRSYLGKDGKQATDKNIEYYINFNDPTKIERDMGTIIFAILFVAMRGRQTVAEGTPNYLSVYEHMRSCAHAQKRVLKTFFF